VVKLYPPKLTYSRDHVLATKGCCTLKFVHMLENDQVLLVPPPGMGFPLTFFQRESKIGLNFSKCAPKTLGVVGVSSLFFATGRASRWA